MHLLQRFGSLKATKKISLKIEAPRVDAIKRSRISPRIRERKIPAEVVKKALKIITRSVTLSAFNKSRDKVSLWEVAYKRRGIDGRI